jgi:hypothetical protein
VRAAGGQVILIPYGPGQSTTNLIERIKGVRDDDTNSPPPTPNPRPL